MTRARRPADDLQGPARPSDRGPATRAAVLAATGRTGGAERYVVRLYSALRDRGVDPVLGGHLPDWREAGLPAVDLGLSDKWGARTVLPGLTRLPRERASAARFLAQARPTLSHMHFKREQLGLTDLAAQHGPVVWTEHGQFSRGPYGRAVMAAYRRTAHRTAAIACVSDVVARDVRAVVGARANVLVIPNAVDRTEFAPATPEARAAARRRLGLPDDPDQTVLVHAGRLDASKRPRLAHRVAVELGAWLLVAGDGPERAALEADARGTRTRVLGPVADVAELYRAADAHLFTSDGSGEGLPTVLLEAAACNLPSVGVQGCGFERHLVEAGGRVATEDVHDLASAVRGAVAASREGGRQARDWSREYGRDLWLDRHLELFASLR